MDSAQRCSLSTWLVGIGSLMALAVTGCASATAGGAGAETDVSPSAENAPPSVVDASLVFDGVTVVDVEQGKLVPDQRVVVTGNLIATVGSASAVKIPKDAQVVDAKGKYLIPGLWDMHCHIFSNYKSIYPLLIAKGITGIRDPAGTGTKSPLTNFEPEKWQREVMARTLVGPRQPKSVGAWRLQAHLKDKMPDEIDSSIGAAKAEGAQFVKIAPSSYVGNAYPPETYFAVLAAARRYNLHVVGHPPPSAVTLVEGADSGQRSFEHLYWIYQNRQLMGTCWGTGANLPACQATAHALRNRNAWITPTVLVAAGMTNAVALRAQTELLTMMREADMPLLAGSDIEISVSNGGIHDELARLVTMGLTPLTALQTATLNPAKYWNAADSLGTVAAGKLADLVLLDADPLADITNTMKIRAVVANGRYFDRAALDGLAAH